MTKHPGFSVAITDLAYIAGIVDGEGCFDVHADNRSHSLIPRIRVEMAERSIIEWIQEKLPGNKISVANRRKNLNHSSTYRWSVNGRQALSVTELLAPFLKGKRDQAEIFLKFPYTKFRGNGRPVPHSILESRIKIRDDLRKLKTKGRGLILNNEFYRKGVEANGNKACWFQKSGGERGAQAGGIHAAG